MHTARSVQSRSEQYEDALQHLLWPAQSPYLNIISFRGLGDKQIASSSTSQATRSSSSRRAAQYHTGGCSELVRVYRKKDTSCITGKWRPNSVLIKKCVSVTTNYIILSTPVTVNTAMQVQHLNFNIDCI